MSDNEQMRVSDPASIAEYHVHVYYDPQTTREHAERLRARVAAEFPRAKLGRWHDELVGPHMQSSLPLVSALTFWWA